MKYGNIEIPNEFLKNMHGNTFVLYKGLLYLAHKNGLEELHVDLLDYDKDEKLAIVKAKAILRDEEGYSREFSAIGDASPKNVNGMIAPHVIRMAGTRAKARALRDALGIGICSVEELGDGEISKDNAFDGSVM